MGLGSKYASEMGGIYESKVGFLKILKISQEKTVLEYSFCNVVCLTCKLTIKLQSTACESFLENFLDIFREVFFETPLKNSS